MEIGVVRKNLLKSTSVENSVVDHDPLDREECPPTPSPNPTPDQSKRSVGAGSVQSNDDLDPLIRQEEVAIVLGVTPRCLENWRHRGGGPSWIRISVRCVRYRRSDLIQFVEERVQTNTSDVGADAA